MKKIENMNAIEREFVRLGLIPLSGQYDYGQPIWTANMDEDDDAVAHIHDGQEGIMVDAAAFAAGLADLDAEDDVFEEVWELANECEMVDAD